jgi:hypothetical protein
MLLGWIPQTGSRYGTGRWQQGREKFGGRRSGRPWSKNGRSAEEEEEKEELEEELEEEELEELEEELIIIIMVIT